MSQVASCHKGGSACHRPVCHKAGSARHRGVLSQGCSACHNGVAHVPCTLGRQVLWADRHRTDRCDNLVFRIGSGMGCIGKIRLDCLTWDGPVAQCALPSRACASASAAVSVVTEHSSWSCTPCGERLCIEVTELRCCDVSELRCCAFSSFWGMRCAGSHQFIEPCSL